MNALLQTNPQGDWYLGGQLLHPAQDPLAAARNELAGLLATAKPEDLVILAGCGLGWHAKAIRELDVPPQMVAYEPMAEMRRALAEQGPDLDGLDPAGDEQSLLADLARRLVYGRVGRVAVFSPPAYRDALPEVNTTAQRILAETRSRGRVDRQTRMDKGGLWRENLAANFKHTLKLPDVTLLANALTGVPALVVGAGPSLDQSLADIRRASGSMLVLAAASAVKPLQKAGIKPVMALALEGADESRQFQGTDTSRTILAAASSGHPAHFDNWPGKQAIFHLQPWVSALTGQGMALPHGGHVGSAAFALAVLWGCDPVVLAGQDLGYTGGRFHAADRPGGEDYDKPDMTPVKAIGGGEVLTSAEFASYRGWYTEAAAYLKKAAPHRRVINATAAGAEIPGFEHAPLARAAKGLKPLGLGFQSLSRALDGLPLPSRRSLAGRLALARADLKRAARVALAQGLGAALAGTTPASPAGDVLGELPPDASGAEAAGALEQTAETLRDLEVNLHG
jgi:hypothetical protein